MGYPERKPIYDAYKLIIQRIIDEKAYKEYADGEIDGLDQDLLSAFKDIRRSLMLEKKWRSKSE
jgi:hypothetical protein